MKQRPFTGNAFLGVYRNRHHNVFDVWLTIDGKDEHVGSHGNELEAASMYNRALQNYLVTIPAWRRGGYSFNSLKEHYELRRYMNMEAA